MREEYQKRSKRLKYLVIFFLVVVFGNVVMLWHPFSRGYYSSISVTFDQYDYPFITSQLQNRSFPLALDVGSRFPLALRRQTLDGIYNKQPQDAITVRNIDGLIYEARSYLIPKLQVGDLFLKNVIAHESHEEDYDALGRFFGGEFNLLLDFAHSRVIACDTFSKLQDKKIAGKDWVRTPFEMHCGGIILKVNTEYGTRKLAINTTCTFTHLRSSLISPSQSSFKSSFSLEGRQLGNITFRPVDLPEGFNGIDGFIGMDFLKTHAIYIDYKDKIAYIEPPQVYDERIPISFISRGSPTVDVSIQGNLYSLEIDLGSSFPFSLSEEILQNINKTDYGTAEWSDFKGQKYQSPAYTIPEVKIGNLTFTNQIATQNREDFHINATLEAPSSQPIGAIGLPILETFNLFLDFPHSAIYACSDYNILQERGLLSQHLLAVPFKLHRNGILFPVETDTGIHPFILDTGATLTAVRAPHQSYTKTFRMMGHDFGGCFIKVVDLSPCFEFDGVLGMDFLLDYPCFIDYTQRVIYVDLQRNIDPI